MTAASTATPQAATRPRSLAWPVVLRDAAIVVVASAGIALLVNALRPTGRLALVAQQEYQILVPCPEHQGSAAPLAAAAVDPARRGVVIVDAREAEDFARWHLPGAISIPFDYLEPVARDKVRAVLERRPQQVLVYGDGENPDSGEQLALQISGAGVKSVHFVKGGAPALRGPAPEGKAPVRNHPASTEAAEAPRWQGARRADTGGIQPTSNAASADGSAAECKGDFDRGPKR